MSEASSTKPAPDVSDATRLVAVFEKAPNLILAGALFLTVIVATWQGNRVRHLRESEAFYRWILGEAIRSRVFEEEDDFTVPGTGGVKMLDRELFQSVVDATEHILPDVATSEEDLDEDGQPLSRLALLVRDGTQDRLIWALASGPALKGQREDFQRYSREKRLTPVGSRFDPSAIYAQGGASVSLSNIFFGFRKVAANFVYLQWDRYWHQGMIHRMIPIMNTCVALDPNFVDAFLLGAWHLAYNVTAHMPDTPEPLKEWNAKYKVRLGKKELYYYLAVDFLKDGIRKNPRNYKLYFDLGFGIYKIKLRDYANAVRYLSEAIRHRHDKWVPRQLYQCLELNGQYEESLAGWEDYHRKNPDFVRAGAFVLRNKALIKERDADKALERAKTLEDPVAKNASVREGKGLRQEAIKIWEEMDEPFSKARILRLRALEYIEEERYIEAIGLLDHARFESPGGTFFDEMSDLIIETKLKAGLPLSKYEQVSLERKKEAEKYKNMPPPEEQV